MNVLVDPKAQSKELARDAALFSHESKSLLRFIACGSVDHGKSSLLGRLLTLCAATPGN
jgi:GTPase